MSLMAWIWVGVWGGVAGVWFGTIWLFYMLGVYRGRLEALEDAIGGRAWLLRQARPDSKLEQVSRAITLALLVGGKQPDHRLVAAAAVGAMRHPTHEMVGAVTPYVNEDWHDAFLCWYDLMIDAAMSPDGGPDAPGVSPQSVESIRRALAPFTPKLGANGHDFG